MSAAISDISVVGHERFLGEIAKSSVLDEVGDAPHLACGGVADHLVGIFVEADGNGLWHSGETLSAFKSIRLASSCQLVLNGRFACPREMGYAGAMASTKAPPTRRYEVAQPLRAEPRAFPGCKAVNLPRTQIDRFEGRLEYWDAATETAWICDPTTPYHERPSRLLTRLAERIAGVRGSQIECYGSMDLLLRDAGGEPRRIMQADESVYLHPGRARPGPAAMVVGEDDFPDVVLEVDHTTDARRGKLALYEEWGFPEVWVEVPEAPSPSRARGRLPGLTIHLLEHGRFRVAAESRAFPGLQAEEVHEALNEAAPSARTTAAVERVAAALGVREGTGPDDDPLFRSQRRQGIEHGRAEGHARAARKA